MRLFDPLPRRDHRYASGTGPSAAPRRWWGPVDRHGYPRRTDSHFTYLNESARPEAGFVRLAYRDWLSRYPLEARGQLIEAFRSGRDDSHTAAAFELSLHEALLGLGAGVSVPPHQAKGGTRYDFDVDLSGDVAAIEASVVSDEADDERARTRRHDLLLDGLDEDDHPRFRVHLWECSLDPQKTPSVRRLRQGILQVLEGFSDEDYARFVDLMLMDRCSELPRFSGEHNGTRLCFSPVPRPPGPSRERLITKLPLARPFESISIGDAIRRKMRDKANQRYNVGERPLILALAVTHWAGADDFEVFRALYGTERWPVIQGPQGPAIGESYRDSDGLWGPHSKFGVSSFAAVLVQRRFHVWSPWQSNWRIYASPWNTKELPRRLLELPGWLPDGAGSIRLTDGLPLRDVLKPPFNVPED